MKNRANGFEVIFEPLPPCDHELPLESEFAVGTMIRCHSCRSLYKLRHTLRNEAVWEKVTEAEASIDIVTTDKQGRTIVDGARLLQLQCPFLKELATHSDGTIAKGVVISVDPVK